jgi:hypothetical protein
MSKPTPKQLRNAVTEMDGLAQYAFGEIETMVSLALLAMEQPGTYANAVAMDAIANTLIAIKSKAVDIGNCINCEAESVGCNYVDDAQRRRWDAQSKARQTIIDGGT